MQTGSESWQTAKTNRPRRAAVSAFGFGGINAHMLLEEYDENSEVGMRNAETWKIKNRIREKSSCFTVRPCLSSAVRFLPGKPPGRFRNPHSANPNSTLPLLAWKRLLARRPSLREFQELILNGKSNIGNRPRQRWKDCDRIAERHLNSSSLKGGYCNELSVGGRRISYPAQ